MTTPVRPDRLLRFGEFALDPDAGELRRNGTRVSLPEQPFRLLTVLLERPGSIATRDELRERLWGADTFVDFEHGLNAAVKRLRDALGDSAEQPRYIETVPKRGYRFIATLDGVVTAPTAPQATSAPSGRRRLWLGAGIAVTVVVVGLVAAAFWPVRPSASVPTASSSARNERRLTRGDGLQINPAWSPDGRMIAYASAAAGTWDIWIQPVGGGPALQVTKLPGAELSPSWSPDGSRILFHGIEPEGVFTVPVLGGVPHRLTTFGARPQWSPDGREILFGATDGGGNGVRQRLYLVGTDGRPPRPVLERELSSLDDVLSWCWQSDSRRVSVVAARPGHPASLFTLPIEGGALVETRMPSGVLLNHLVQSSWAADGRTVYVVEWRTDGTMDVWRLSLDPKTLQVQRADQLKAGGASVLDPAISPDRTRLAFVLPTSSTRLWSVPLDVGTTTAGGDGTPVTEPGAEAGNADLAADGRSIAYVSWYRGSPSGEMHVRDLTSGARRTLANDGHHRGSLQWSRDGQWLAYGIFLRMGDDTATREAAIAVRRLSSNEERIITTRRAFRAFHAYSLPTDWSPNGDAVLAASDYLSPHMSLALFPVDAAPAAEKAATVVVSDPDYNVWQGNYSPNGRWLAFVAQSRGNGRTTVGTTTVEIVSSDGGPTRAWLHVTTSPAADKPRWSPDGRWLYYTQDSSVGYNVWRVPFDPERGRLTGPASQVTRFTNPDHLLSTDLGSAEPSVSRTFMILPIMERRGSIWMLDGVDR
jgi:Tol biopolymer transport system component/DNA-binding winged helix-turn-helix (wHTH) protein